VADEARKQQVINGEKMKSNGQRQKGSEGRKGKLLMAQKPFIARSEAGWDKLKPETRRHPIH
jgi:hypothetical protein